MSCVCTLSHGQMYFHFGRALTQNSWICPIISYLLDGWPGDATFPLWGQPLKIIRMYSAKKRSSPLDFIFDTCASASSSHLFGWWSWTYVVVDFFKDKCMFSKKPVFWACVGTQLLNFCPIISYLWVVGLVMRLFSCGANLWRSSACIQPKKVQPLGIYFWHLRLGLFKSPFLVGEAEHMWLQPFARTNVFSAKNICFAFWARVQDKCTPLQGQMYLWNLFLMSNLRTFSNIIIIAPFSQI